MKQTGIYLLVALLVQSFCVADVTKLPAAQRKVLEDSSRFHEVLATTNLPPSIVALCADEQGRLAEPGQKWEATDVIADDALPRKRLIWAAVSGECYVLHCERGGRGHSFQVLVATLPQGELKPKTVWRGMGGRLKNYAAFVGALQSGKLEDALDDAP